VEVSERKNRFTTRLMKMRTLVRVKLKT